MTHSSATPQIVPGGRRQMMPWNELEYILPAASKVMAFRPAVPGEESGV